MINKIVLDALGYEFDVKYTAYKGRPGTYFEPPEPSELCIEEVYLGDCEVIDLLSDKVLDKIYEELDNVLSRNEEDY